MHTAHLTNLAIHIGAGLVALLIGLRQLAATKGSSSHRRWGRRFCYAGLLVSLSAAVGLVLFRFLPMFAVLTVLVTYQIVSGWRAAITREQGPAPADGLWTLAGIVAAALLVPVALRPGNAPSLVYGALGGLAAVLFYDAVRWRFPRHWFSTLWRYEHSYKLIASLFGMLSALVGNVVRFWQPWSQILPLAIGTVVVAYFFAQLARQDAAKRKPRRAA